MTNKIVKAIEDNNLKFIELKNLATKLVELKNQRNVKENQLIEVYNIIFKNLSSKKKLVHTENQKEIYIGRDGVSYKNKGYGLNTTNIANTNIFRAYIQLIDEHITSFMKVLPKTKQKKFKDFMQKSYLYYNYTPHSNKDITPIIIKNHCNDNGIFKEEEIKNIKIQVANMVKVILNGESTTVAYHNSNDFDLLNPRTDDYIVFEQLYPLIKNSLKSLIKTKEKDLDNITKYLNDLDLKFSTYIKSILMLRELKKES